MRHSDIPYVKNPPAYYPPVDYKKMNLKELIEKYIKACGKANGSVSVCSQCKSPCEHGKRAIQLVANEVYNDPPVPLYGGKTLIERAKEENMLRREKEAAEKANVLTAEKKETKEPEKKKRGEYLRGDEWWKASLEYGDQVEYLINKYGYSRTKAKTTIYRYRSRHGLVGTPMGEKIEGPTVKMEPEPIKEEPTKEVPKVSAKNDILISTMEQKLSDIMKKQEEYKKLADKYQKMYADAKEQADVLCKAIEMFTQGE